MAKSMTKERLEQFYSLKTEIGMLEYQISTSGHMVSDKVKGSLPEFPWTEVSVYIVGYDEMVATRLNHRRRELIQERKAIEDFLDSIPDSYIRRLITLKYVEGLTWLQVAQRCRDMGATEDSARMKVDRFFEKMQK